MTDCLERLKEAEPKLLRGRKEIANFLGYNLRTVDRLIKEGKIAVHKDPMGKWVMFTADYYDSLKPYNREG